MVTQADAVAGRHGTTAKKVQHRCVSSRKSKEGREGEYPVGEYRVDGYDGRADLLVLGNQDSALVVEAEVEIEVGLVVVTLMRVAAAVARVLSLHVAVHLELIRHAVDREVAMLGRGGEDHEGADQDLAELHLDELQISTDGIGLFGGGESDEMRVG